MKEKFVNLLTSHKKLFILIASGIVLGAAILTTVLLYINQSKGTSSTATYREYTAAKGNITVGTSETGTATLDQVTVSFPVDATIDTVQVKPGYKVKAGDALLKLNQDSITDGTLDSTTKLAQAKLSLEQALADQTNKLKSAQLTYDTSRQNAADAYTQESLAKEDVQNGITDAQAALKDKQTQLAKYQALQSSFTADYNKLNELKKWRDDAKTNETSYETQLSSFKDQYAKQLSTLDSLDSKVNSTYATWELAKQGIADANGDADEDEAKIEYDAAKDAYDAYSDIIASTVQGEKDLENKVALYTAEYNNYSSSYDDFNQTFSEKYGNTSTADALADEVSQLQSDVKTAQYNLEKAQKSSTGSINEAEQKLQSSLNDGSSAQSTYDLTVEQLAQAVQTQQATYDSLKRQLDDVNSAISGDGTISSPCDGVIVSVSYTDGSSVKADAAMVTIAKTSNVNMAVSLSEEDITDIKIGQQAQVTLTAYENQTFDATVESIATSPARTGSASVTYTVTVKMTGDSIPDVYTGMSGEVTFIQKQKKDVLYVPNQAITFDNGISSVLLKNADGTQTKTTVTTGFSDGRYVEILSGLKEGDTVLAESAVVK